MKPLGLLLATAMAVVPLHASAVGCEHDMQCKGERICQKGQCVDPATEDQGIPPPAATKNIPAPQRPTTTPTATRNVSRPQRFPMAPSVTKNVPAPVQPAMAPREAKSVSTPEQPAMTPSAVKSVPAGSTEFRYCCTKVGKFPLDRDSPSDDDSVRDTCHGLTSYGASLPGMPCN